ncbi:hypothetical protein [Glaciimonas immobilis]|uniref:Uncharacterized protein n=1 Tax=Glaciimonas immobilis TaxID=728004 RepID=A0A840RRZ6_9BURK|nr:hypothetical protein [Glaciimonas immobilis]KAF3996412.1 hypothetical protein HAV38_17280 [Glaciimonas immobilis]MBB5201257.1 hypothetical protein [Glaciimonas immobilis]
MGVIVVPLLEIEEYCYPHAFGKLGYLRDSQEPEGSIALGERRLCSNRFAQPGTRRGVFQDGKTCSLFGYINRQDY